MRNKKPTYFILADHLYDTRLLITVGMAYKKVIPVFNKHLKIHKSPLVEYSKETESQLEASSGAVIFNNSCKHLCIWFRDVCPGSGVTAHEAFHATHHILSRRGLKLSDESEEAYAYLLAWIIRGIGNRLW